MKNLLEQFNPSKTNILSRNYLIDFEYLFFISLSHFLFLWLNIYCINNTSKSYCHVLLLFRVYILFSVKQILEVKGDSRIASYINQYIDLRANFTFPQH